MVNRHGKPLKRAEASLVAEREVKIAEAVIKEGVSALNLPVQGLQVQSSCTISTGKRSRLLLKSRYPAFDKSARLNYFRPDWYLPDQTPVYCVSQMLYTTLKLLWSVLCDVISWIMANWFKVGF